MQPENNMQNMESMGSGMPQENMMAQGVPTMARGGSEKKKNKGMLYGMICLAILAVGGIGFGVWAMLSGNQQAESLNNQIADLKQTNSELLDQMATDANEGDTIINIDNSDDAVNTADYIYVGEWGLKIKLADQLEVATYTYDYGDGYTVLKVSGATNEGQTVPDFAQVGKCSLGSVERYTLVNVNAGVVPDWYGEPFMTDDEYNYYYNSPQALCTEVQDYAQWELSTADAIKNMLTSSDNYSKI